MRTVLAVAASSIAARHGIRPGDRVEAINGEKLLDEIDYQALSLCKHVRLQLVRPNNSRRLVEILNPAQSPLGLTFEDTLIASPRVCANRCIFCFVDQMPLGMRPSLYVKDDDWRLSLMMGNYVTLSNVTKAEFARILRRRASPLYISVHATDPQVRRDLMGNRNAGDIMQRLQQLREHGLRFHAQIVLCPGINDGTVLDQTIADLAGFFPHLLSVALVPVGLTRHRAGLTPLQGYGAPDAAALLRQVQGYQAHFLHTLGTRLCYAADEFVCLSGASLPPPEEYEGYPQVENGVGMLRQFEEQLRQAHLQPAPPPKAQDSSPGVCIACGVSVFPFMQRWMAQFAPRRLQVRVRSISNTFFGPSVTVSGLMTGQDIAAQLADDPSDILLLPASVLNADESLLLDDMTPAQLEAALGKKVIFVQPSGEALLALLHSL